MHLCKDEKILAVCKTLCRPDSNCWEADSHELRTFFVEQASFLFLIRRSEVMFYLETISFVVNSRKLNDLGSSKRVVVTIVKVILNMNFAICCMSKGRLSKSLIHHGILLVNYEINRTMNATTWVLMSAAEMSAHQGRVTINLQQRIIKQKGRYSGYYTLDLM